MAKAGCAPLNYNIICRYTCTYMHMYINYMNVFVAKSNFKYDFKVIFVCFSHHDLHKYMYVYTYIYEVFILFELMYKHIHTYVCMYKQYTVALITIIKQKALLNH